MRQQLVTRNVLCTSMCSEYTEPMTSHAVGGLAGSRRTLSQRSAGGRHCRHLESIKSYQNCNSRFTPNFIDNYRRLVERS